MASFTKKPKLERGDFVEGSITRIKLEKFLTYDSVEFRPGPSLNVIIGPNGTGKSTIVCAICLGLAGKPNLLGRALQPAEYIKHGCHKAIIEIELYNTDAPENYIIKREIQKDNTNKWMVNGRSATQKSIEDMVLRLNIQVGNLCQFLPQDKVSDFAKMTQQELLENTEKAVGPPEMFEQHQRLKVARGKERELELTHTRGKEQLEQEQALNARLEQDVKNYEDRQRHMDKVNKLRMKRPWVEYEEKRKEHLASKELKDALATQVRKAREENSPLQRRLEAAQKRIKEVEAQMKKLGENVEDNARRAAESSKNIEKLGDQVQEHHDELNQKRQEEQNRWKKLKDLNDQLRVMEGELSNVEDEDIQPALDQVGRDMNQLNRDMSHVKQRAEQARMAYNSTRRDVTTLQAELRDLQDQNNRRLTELRRRHKDTYDAVLWLRANRHLFKGHIYEPMMLVINMKDARMAKYLESHITFNDMKAFVYEQEDDMELFLRTLRDEQKLRVNMVGVPNQGLSAFKATRSIAELKGFGFNYYLKELFDCPEAVMRYLCWRYNVHQIPVGTAYTKSHVEEVIKANPYLHNFYTENHQYSIKQSRYSRAISSRCTELKRASLLDIGTNSVREREISAELQAKQREVDDHEKQCRKHEHEYKDFDKQMNGLRNKKKELQNQKSQRRTLEQKINMNQDKIRRIEAEALDMEKEEKMCKIQIQEILKRKCRMLKELQSHTQKCLKLSEDKIRQSLIYSSSIQEQNTVEEELREQSYNLKTLEAEYEKKTELVKRLKRKALALFDVAKDVCNLTDREELSEVLKKAFASLPETLERIDAVIHEEQARADCTFQTDESVVKEYQTREKRIRHLTNDVRQREEALEEHQTLIEAAKEQWLEPLKELISRINTNFSYFFTCMKCAGEVDLNIPENPEDYEKYGVRIKVLFRDNEQLRELTPHHQSGGERSVATVLYMMALQELTRVPFRCVDEINQGMDPQNERKVFELVVQTACSITSSQYFLLTPKLLPDLQYSDKMTVLCVCNGPFMINHEEWRLSKFMRRRARLC